MFRLRHVATSRGTDVSVVTVQAPGADRGPAPVLLLHPVNTRKECWLGVLPALAAERDCVLVDLPGHGESSDDDFSLDGWVSDSVDVVAHLGLDRVHVVGGSLGGPIALGIAVAMPDRVLSVTGFGSTVGPMPSEASPPAPADDAEADELFASLAREALAPGAPEELVETVRLLTNRHGADVVTRVLRAAYDADATGLLDSVGCSVLWAVGEHDVTCPPPENERIAGRLGGRAVVLPGVGHLPMVENPELLLEHLLPHLRAADS